jgi:hypothetical protein
MPFSVWEEAMKSQMWTRPYENRRGFIGGSDARIIVGNDETALCDFGAKNGAG